MRRDECDALSRALPRAPSSRALAIGASSDLAPSRISVARARATRDTE